MTDLDTTTPFSLFVCSGTEMLGVEARLLERAVFLDAFGNTPELMHQEYGRYEDHSIFVVVVDNEADRVAGMIRFIGDRAGELKSLADIERPPWATPLVDVLHDAGLDDLDLGRTLDIATLAVHPDYRRGATKGLVSLALYQAVCQLVVAAGMTHFVAILDCVVLRSIQARTAKPFRYFPGIEPARYLDSPASVPVYCDAEAYRERLREEHPDIHEILFEGIGFESVISPVNLERGRTLVESITTQVPARLALVEGRAPSSETRPETSAA